MREKTTRSPKWSEGKSRLLFGETGSGIQRNLATGAWVDVALAPLPYLSFALRGEGFRDETADQSYRLLARVAGYLF